MPQIFLKLLNMSISASWVVLAVLLLRSAMKKAPKWMTCALWAVVAIRLVIPFSIESMFSLIPTPVSSGTMIQEVVDDYVGTVHIYEDNTPEYQQAVDAGIPVINAGKDQYYVVTGADGISEPSTVGNTIIPILCRVWLVGIALLLVYAAVSYLRLKWKVSASINLRHNIYLCDYIESPFILGIIRPRIYLPTSLDETSIPHVLAHENAHLARKDHWWKPLGFALLCLHWFNPLMWLAYILLCKDIELACDEKVIKELGEGEKRSYSQALLQCSVPRHLIAACPLAFGEVGVKERVKTVLDYKKPAFWIILIALVVCIAVAVCFLTDPVTDDPTPTVSITEDASSFWAEVLEVNGNSILVCPDPGTQEAKSSDKITLTVPAGCAIPAVGDRVRIDYDGKIAESYPAQIHSCINVTVVGQSLAQLSSGCNPEQIVSEGGYLMINGDYAAGKDALTAFVQGAKQGYPATIRFASYYTLGDPDRYGDEYYAEIRDTYPMLFVHDLTFNGTEYILRWYEDGQEILRVYPYLLHFTGEPESAYATYESYERYVLCDRNDVTWDEIQNGSYSADFNDQIPYFTIFTDYRYAEELTLTDLEQARTQLEPYMPSLDITYMEVNPVTGLLDIRAGEFRNELFETVKQYIDLRYATIVIDGTVPDIQVPSDSPIGVSLELVDADFHGATIRYTVDPKDADAVWANYDYRLEVLTQAGWQSVPGYDPTLISWEDASIFSAEKGETVVHEEYAQWERLTQEELDPGQYRFCKDIYYTVGGKTQVMTCYAEFELLPYHISMRIEQGDAGESTIVLSHRLMGTGEIWAYKDFTLEYQTDGQWVTLAPPADRVNNSFWFRGTGHNDPNGKASVLRHRLDLSELTDQPLEPGLYRISVPIYITCGDYPATRTEYVETVSAQFAILPEEIPSYGSLNDAILDGCVTMVNGDVVAGQRAWKNFVDTTAKGQAASIRIFTYLTLSSSVNYDPAGFQEVFSKYPVVVIQDLVYDGYQYSLYSYQNGRGNFSQYPYLLHYTGSPEDQYADYDSFDRYVLCNDNTMTWEELRSHMGVSSTHVRQREIVTDLIYKDEPTLEQLEAVMNQLDDYWVEYEIVSMDANELTGKLDICVSRWVDGLDTLIERYIPLRWVTITHQDGWSRLEEVTALAARFPEYFDLSTSFGLELYALEDGYVLMANASQAKDEQQIQAMPRASANEMALILESYQVHIDPMRISVINRTDRTEYDIRKELGIYPACNVKIELSDVTGEGATITYIIHNLDDKEVWAGPEFYLEVWNGTSWQPFGYDKDQLAWDTALEFHMVGKNPDQTVFVTEDKVVSSVEWSRVAEAPLPAGMYQLCKTVYIHSNGETQAHTCYGIFTIP